MPPRQDAPFPMQTLCQQASERDTVTTVIDGNGANGNGQVFWTYSNTQGRKMSVGADAARAAHEQMCNNAYAYLSIKMMAQWNVNKHIIDRATAQSSISSLRCIPTSIFSHNSSDEIGSTDVHIASRINSEHRRYESEQRALPSYSQRLEREGKLQNMLQTIEYETSENLREGRMGIAPIMPTYRVAQPRMQATHSWSLPQESSAETYSEMTLA